MPDDFVASLDKEISALEAEFERDPRYLKLKDLRRIRMTYYGGELALARPPKTEQPPKRGRRTSADRAKALAEAENLIRGRLHPTKTADIFDHIEAQGIQIGGKEPKSNLSAMLYHAPQFKSHGRAGWTLASPENTEAADDRDPNKSSSTASEEHLTDHQMEPHSRNVEPLPGGGT